MTLTLRYAAQSDRGLIRDGNQDAVYAGPRLLAVADGMGGMAAGDVASNIVIGVLAPLDEDVPGGDLIDRLRQTVNAANQQLREAVEANPQMEGMGTTLTALLFSGSKFGMAHIGDSRAYLLRDGELSQITKDDTYVQMLVDEGRITAEEASSHPQRSLLTRAMGSGDVDPEYQVREARPGDRYLLCSDGLSGVVSQDTIKDALSEIPDPNAAVERLVQLALRGGGPDNVTVIVADVTDADIIEERPVVGGAAAQDRGMATAADQTTAAARASAALTAPPAPGAAPEPAPYDDGDLEEERPKPRRAMWIVAAVVALAVLAGAGWFGWTYTQAQYFVGATDDGTVAVFRGVRGEVAGLRLSTVEVASRIRLDDLVESARNRVIQGIPARDRKHAHRILDDLTRDDTDNKNLLPSCEPTPEDSGSPNGSGPAGGTGPGGGTAPTPSATARPSGSPAPSASPSPEASPSVDDEPKPGEKCRSGD